MNTVVGLLIVLLSVALVGGDRNENQQLLADLKNVLHRAVPLLSLQARQNTSQHQFAFILLFGENTSNFQFDPPSSSGGPLTSGNDNHSCMPETGRVNYIVARPNIFRDGNRRNQKHAEELLKEHLASLWDGYKGKHNRLPHTFVIFTRLFPCTAQRPRHKHDCLRMLYNLTRTEPYNAVRSILVYDPNAPQLNITEQEDIRGMSIYKMPFEPNCFPWDDDYNGRCQSGTLQRIWDPSVMLFSTMLTADNDWCAADMPCGYYNRSYKWCVKAEIDEKGNTEGYCCEGECRNYMCPVGDRISLCSPISTVSSSGPCRRGHVCGHHQSSFWGIPWCYIDEMGNWGYCYNPGIQYELRGG